MSSGEIRSPKKLEILDTKINSTQSDIAIIIEGNQTTHTGGAAVGEYVIIRNSTISGITDGLYKAVQAIPANTVIDSTYLAAVDGGIGSEVATINSKITSNNIVKRINQNTSRTIVFSSYSTVALLYTAIGNSSGCLYVYSNGYLLPIKTDLSITATLASDYKTITVTNAAGAGYLGILCSTDVTVSVS